MRLKVGPEIIEKSLADILGDVIFDVVTSVVGWITFDLSTVIISSALTGSTIVILLVIS